MASSLAPDQSFKINQGCSQIYSMVHFKLIHSVLICIFLHMYSFVVGSKRGSLKRDSPDGLQEQSPGRGLSDVPQNIKVLHSPIVDVECCWLEGATKNRVNECVVLVF